MPSRDRCRKRPKTGLQDYIVYLSFVAVLLIFYLSIGSSFVTADNLRNIAIQSAVSCVSAAGMVMVISCGMIDLSIGAMASLTSVVIGLVLRSTGSLALSLACGFLTGAAIGAINGLLITMGHLPPFLVTLGMQNVIFGLAQWMTKMQSIPIYDKRYTSIFGLKEVLGIPILFIWTVLSFVIVAYIMRQTRFGNAILATGASESAAVFTGIHTRWVKMKTMICSGLFSTFAGILYSGRTMAARHSFGEDLTFTVIASVVLGGTLMRGGKARVLGAFAGALLLGMAENGLIIVGFSVSEQMIFKGIILVLATLLGTVSGTREKREEGDREMRKIWSSFRTNYRRNIVYVFFVVLVLFFSLTLGSRGFFSVQNLNNIIVQTTMISIMSVGLVFVFSVGLNDLSIGANLALSGLICAYILRAGGTIAAAVAASLLMGAVLGLLNGLLVTYGNLPAWLATVGTQTIVRGIAMYMMDTDYAVEIKNRFFLLFFGQGTLLGIPVLFYWTLFIALLGYLFLYKHGFGAKVLAVGGNEVAAQYSGIRTVRIKILCMFLCGIVTAFAGVLNAARLSSARYTVGDGVETNVIAAVVLGGTSMTGGKGNVIGALVGSLLIGIINSGLIIGGLTSSLQMIVSGIIIIIALLLGEKDIR